MTKEFRILARTLFESATGELDSYSLFVERSVRLLQADGVLSFILPDTWLTLIHGEKFRRWLLERYELAELALLNGLVFNGVVVDTMLLFVVRKKPSLLSLTKVICAKKDERITNVAELPICATFNQLGWLSEPQARIKVFAAPEFESILTKARINSMSVDALIEYRAGCKPYEVGKGKPPQTKEVMASKPFTKSTHQGKGWMPLLRGNDIQRYAVNSKRPEWIHYGEWLAAMRSMDVFSGPRILIQVVRNPSLRERIVAALSDQTFITRMNVFSLL